MSNAFSKGGLSLVLAASICLPAFATAPPQDPASAAAKGRIAPFLVVVTDPALPTAQSKHLTAKASAMIGQVLKTPAFSDLHGFSLTRSLKVDPPLEGFGWHPARGEVVMIAQEIDLSANPKPDADGAYMGRLEGPTFRININDLTALYANVSDEQALTDTLTLPMMRVSDKGYPVFRVGLRDVIVISHKDRTPYVPVSKAEYLQSLLNAEAKASLTPEDGAAPACASARLSEAFGDCSAEGAAFYVRLNTDYFQRGKGDGSVQLITVSVPAEGRDGHKRLEPKLRDAAGQLDLDALRALLD